MEAATEPGDGDANAITRRIDIENDIEGDFIDTEDYFFDRIGKPIPICKNLSAFSLESPPSRALAVSETHRLLFVAQSSGFCVARTKDLIDAASKIEEKTTDLCVQELSVVNVPIGNVRILELSSDSSTLAVSVQSSVYFFSVESLLDKEEKPLSSCSLSEGSSVKDFRWRRSSDNSFIVLSNVGKLYHGVPGGALRDVLDNVDAVDWSVRGKFIAVARGNIISILSAKFKEKLSIALPFKSWVNDSEYKIVKVDSIRWIRRDSIVVGCFQQTADGREENYLLQVLRSNNGKFNDASCKPVVLSFYDTFPCINDDIVPYGSGPYLYMSNLKQCGLAVAANRKNTDGHIVLLSWLPNDDSSGIALVDIDRDNCRPRIEDQDNGEENLIMGLCVDGVSLYGKFKVEAGVEDQIELSPSCVLICATVDGKLVMFNVASIEGDTFNREAESMLDDEEEGAPEDFPVRVDNSEHLEGQKVYASDQVDSSLQVQDLSSKESDIVKVSETPARNSLIPSSGKSENSTPVLASEQIVHEVTISKNLGGGSALAANSFFSGSQEKVPAKELYQGIDGQQPQLLWKGTDYGKSSSSIPTLQGATCLQSDSSKIEAHKFPGFGASPVSSLKKNSASTSLSYHQDSGKRTDLGKETMGKHLSAVSQISTPLCPSGELIPSQCYESGSSFQPSTWVRLDGTCPDVAAAIVSPSDQFGKSSQVKESSFGPSPVDTSVRATQIESESAPFTVGKIESLPSLRSPQLSMQESFTREMSPGSVSYSFKNGHKASTILNSEPNISRQFGNIKDMVNELDTLLECIEGRGGFRDSCTEIHRSSVEALEVGMGTLFKRCREWKCILEERLGEIQHLPDKTVQIWARRKHVEDIIKQTCDSQYWELRNHQNLSPELELKRRHILKLNQDLTSQIIELERHFNALELQRFDENVEVHTRRKIHQSRHTPPRQPRALQSLYNTMSSQLAAAEQLSECLSKQMATLRVESPAKQQNVKKELFEMIGLPYDASFSSPDILSNKKLSLSSSTDAINSCSRKLISSSVKGSDSESARRRRDSLDQSLTRFEPTKTTVKRMNMQEIQERSAHRSPLFSRVHQSGAHMMNAPAVPQQEAKMLASTMLLQSGDSVKPDIGNNQYTFVKQPEANKLPPFKWANESAQPSQVKEEVSPLLRSKSSGISLVSVSQGLSAAAENQSRETRSFIADKWANRFSSIGKSDPVFTNETKSVDQSSNNLQDRSIVSSLSPAQMPSLLQKPTEKPNLNTKAALDSGSILDNLKHESNARRSFSESTAQSANFTGFPPASIPVSPVLPGKAPQLNNESTKAQAAQDVPSSTAASSQPKGFLFLPTFGSSTEISSSSNMTASTPAPASVPPTLSATPISFSSSVSKTSIDSNQTVSSTHSQSVSSSLVPPSAVPSSTRPSKVQLPSFTSPSVSDDQTTAGKTPTSLNPLGPPLLLEPFKTEIHRTTEKSSSAANPQPTSTSESTATAVQPPTTTDSISSPDTDKPSAEIDAGVATTAPQTVSLAGVLKPESPVASVSAAESTATAPGSQTNFNLVSQASNAAASVPAQETVTLFGSSFSTSINGIGGKRENLDSVVTEEDEMEEEAPDTSGTNELNLGSLGSFGIGSTPSPAVPKSNPFGGPFGNTGASQTSSPFSMTVPSGELFRPASFSFQSPQPSQPSQPTNLGAFSGGFGSATASQSPTNSGFGQPSQIGSVNSGFGQPSQIGAGQQALGSVLGSFGQSRQFGTASPIGGFGSGFATGSSPGGLSSAATGGGFAVMATSGGGFAGMASGGGGGGGAGGFAGMASGGGGGFGALASKAGGFGAAASGGGGFAGGGFAGAAPSGGFAAAGGGGFGAFSNQQGGGGGGGGFGGFGGNLQGATGFSAFGGGAAAGKPPELFTQIRK